MSTILLLVERTGTVKTIVQPAPEAYTLSHVHRSLADAWVYIYQYTVNAYSRRFELIVQDERT